MSQTFKALNPHSNSDKDILLSLTIGLVAFLVAAHLLIRSSYHGLFFSPDSVEYLSTAENLTVGKGLRTYSYDFFFWWPPLYPLLLAFLSQLGIEVQDASRVVNIVTSGLIVIVTGYWLNRYIRSRLLVIGAVIIISAGHITNLVALFVLSETFFILLLLLALVYMDKFFNQQFPIKSLIISAFFALLASITRHAGIAVIITAIFLIILDWRLSIIRKLRYTIVYIVISLIPVLIRLAYSRFSVNYRISGRLDMAGFTPFRHLKSIIEMLYIWFFLPEPGNIHSLVNIVEIWVQIERYVVNIRPPTWVVYYLWVVASVIILWILISIGIRNRLQLIKPPPSIWHPIHIKPLLIPTSFTVIYLLVILAPFRGNLHINYRYISPIYIPIFICIILVFEQIYRKENLRRAIVTKIALATLLILGCIVHIDRVLRWNISITAKTLEYSNYQPYLQGYGPNSPIIEYLNSNTIDGNILANHIPVIYRMTNLPPPVRHLNCSYWSNDSAEIGEGDLEHDYIILLTKTSTYDTYCDLRAMALQQYQQQQLDLVVEYTDGVVYKVDVAPP